MFPRLAACLLFAMLLVASRPAETAARPNILLILADDMGFSDLGSYGGEIATPNLDSLATNGLRFTQFYNTARCWPTRAALLSGYYPQQIRMDPPRGRLPGWARLLPHHLKPLGYRSYHAGKWHIQGAPRTIADGGFDRSYRLEDHDRNFYPRNHVLDDVRLPPVPKGSNYYTTTAFADFTIQCLRNHAIQFKNQPFFAYLAFTVPHFPLHAPAEDIAPYRDTYLAGWDNIRKQRHERQTEMGLLKTILPDPEPETVPHWNLGKPELREQISPHEVARAVPWNDLTSDQKKFQAAKMAIHAAMVSRMDREIGRVLDQLQAMGALDDTIILFASDNGASAEFLNRGDRHNPSAEPGSAESYLCLGPGWSTTANTPFRLHKAWVHEGGISTLLIVHWPKGIRPRGEFRRTPSHVIDIVPTVLELTGAKRDLASTSAPKMPGRSLVPAFERDVEITREYLFFHHEHNRALRIGDWKLVSKRPATNTYALYNLNDDRTERLDLSASQPDRAASLATRWQQIENEFRATAESAPPTSTP